MWLGDGQCYFAKALVDGAGSIARRAWVLIWAGAVLTLPALVDARARHDWKAHGA